jgi:hypothetical protein
MEIRCMEEDMDPFCAATMVKVRNGGKILFLGCALAQHGKTK